MTNKRILVGISGGVDSLVSAIMVKELGYTPVGVTLHLFQSSASIEQAALICQKLNIEHHVVNAEALFKTEIIDNFVEEYIAGRTPNPCVRCNDKIKWPILFSKAKELHCIKVATGHYAEIGKIDGTCLIKKSDKGNKDQSFFLWNLSPSDINKIHFPLAGMTKDMVLKKALEYGFVETTEQKSSVGTCFTKQKDYRVFLKQICTKQGTAIPSGIFTNLQGEWLGRHNGYPFFTIGQRHGLGIQSPTPYFVHSIDPKSRKIVLSEFAELYRKRFYLENFKIYLSSVAPTTPLEIRVRYRGKSIQGYATPQNQWLQLDLIAPEWGIAPGQAVALYKNDYLVGGGIIASDAL